MKKMSTQKSELNELSVEELVDALKKSAELFDKIQIKKNLLKKQN